MSDPVVAPAEPSFATYVQTENARERSGEPSPPSDAPAPAAITAGSEVASPGAAEDALQAPVDPGVEAKADDRNADGTFKAKPKTAKVSNTGEWARNQRLTAELHDTKAELERLRSTPAPAAQPQPPAILDPSDPEPVLDSFLDKPDPYAALAVAAGKWAVREERRESARQAREQDAREAQAEVATKIETFVASHPDYQEKLASIEDVQFSRDVLTAIADDDLCPAVAYHLATHPDEARRIATLTPLNGVKAIGALSSRLTPAPSGSGPHAVSTSRAKPLIKPVSGSPVAPEPSPPDTLPFGARYIRENNAADRRRREAMRGA